MCGFLLTNLRTAALASANRLQQFRGPDLTTVSRIEGLTFVHNLLSITGATQPQPFASQGAACVYNGEIYNYAELGNYRSDGECIIPLYRDAGLDFTRLLDGEFAIALVDFDAGKVILATDVFATKPLHYAVEADKFAISSYRSALTELGFRAPKKVGPNVLLELDLTGAQPLSSRSVWAFSTRQDVKSFDRWVLAFENAIRKRTCNVREQVFIGLSSGYDSGAIACELARQDAHFAAYSILGNEDEAIVRARAAALSQVAEVHLLRPSEACISKARSSLETRVEDAFYDIYSASSDYTQNESMKTDPAAAGLALICSLASADGRKIYLSGQGADEIISDYGFAGSKIYPHSNFGGLFPADLSSIFPWPSFYASTQASYLMKEEYVAGAFGVEARYPFLDRELVQEFLSLDCSLKNSAYKAPLDFYLEARSFPYGRNKKYGFGWGSADVSGIE